MARQETRQSLEMAQEVGFDLGLSCVPCSVRRCNRVKAVRNAEDLADELRFRGKPEDDQDYWALLRPPERDQWRGSKSQENSSSSASGASGILCSSDAQAPRS